MRKIFRIRLEVEIDQKSRSIWYKGAIAKTYNLLRKRLIPALSKDHRAIEQKKQQKLESLVEMFDVDDQHVKAHVIRTIIMPHVERMNRRWREMTVMQKFDTAYVL